MQATAQVPNAVSTYPRLGIDFRAEGRRRTVVSQPSPFVQQQPHTVPFGGRTRFEALRQMNGALQVFQVRRGAAAVPPSPASLVARRLTAANVVPTAVVTPKPEVRRPVRVRAVR